MRTAATAAPDAARVRQRLRLGIVVGAIAQAFNISISYGPWTHREAYVTTIITFA